MRRRDVLAGVGSAALAALAGCFAPSAADSGPGTTTTPRDEVTLAETGSPSTICEADPSEDPGIYAIVDPAFDTDWSGYDVDDLYGGGLAGDDVVVGIESGGEARAYPLSILWWHEIVNDTVGGEPLMVTYCPLCRSGLVASRVVDGTPTNFLVTGLLWRAPGLQRAISEFNGSIFGANRSATDAEIVDHGNLVMIDEATRSYWSQIVGTAICGPKRGTDLRIRPSTVATWDEWRADHPETSVLLPPPHSTVDRSPVD